MKTARIITAALFTLGVVAVAAPADAVSQVSHSTSLTLRGCC